MARAARNARRERQVTTSSRERADQRPDDTRFVVPWAALLAALIVLAVDGIGLRAFGPWKTIADQAGTWNPRTPRRGLDFGIAHDRQQLQELASARARRAVVVGSSRVAVGFDPAVAREALPGFHVAKVGHAGLDAFVLRSIADDLGAPRPEVAVLLLSEYDTHRPVRLEPTPGKSSADLGAFAQLASLIGDGFAFEHRDVAARLGVSTALESYRYRRVLARTRLGALHTFPLEPRLEPPRSDPQELAADPEHTPISYWDGERKPVPRPTRRQILSHFTHRRGDSGLSLIAETQPGDHARVNMALIETAVSRLRERGVEVVVVEGPIHPAARLSYAPETTEAFRAFARDLAANPGVHFVALDDLPTFPGSEFNDLLHLNETGAYALTRAIARAIDDASGRPGSETSER